MKNIVKNIPINNNITKLNVNIAYNNSKVQNNSIQSQSQSKDKSETSISNSDKKESSQNSNSNKKSKNNNNLSCNPSTLFLI